MIKKVKLSKLRKTGNFLNVINGINNKLTANITCSGKRLNFIL